MKVVFKVRALRDLDEIHAYIARQDLAAARGVIGRIEAAAERLSEFPMSGRTGTLRGTRQVVVTGLPYIIIYRVRDEVDVIAIVHAARRRRS